MDTLNWRHDYELGHDIIDAQHKELFRRINVLGNGLWDGIGKDMLEKHLRFLADYVVEHFATEEQLMKADDYPDFDFHKSEHDAFVQTVSDLLEFISTNGLDSPTVIGAFELSCEWTRAHVRDVDLAFGKFLDEKYKDRQ